MTTSPRDFFESIVKPAYADWESNRQVEWTAKAAIGGMNDMAERVFHYWKTRDVTKVYSAAKSRTYRKALAVNECADFQLVWDITDAHKHIEIDRKPRQVTRSDQTGSQPFVWSGDHYSGGDVYYGGAELVVTLDDGTQRPLSAIMKNVMNMWERLLTEMSL